jgi:hypothetical protein
VEAAAEVNGAGARDLQQRRRAESVAIVVISLSGTSTLQVSVRSVGKPASFRWVAENKSLRPWRNKRPGTPQKKNLASLKVLCATKRARTKRTKEPNGIKPGEANGIQARP